MIQPVNEIKVSFVSVPKHSHACVWIKCVNGGLPITNRQNYIEMFNKTEMHWMAVMTKISM